MKIKHKNTKILFWQKSQEQTKKYLKLIVASISTQLIIDKASLQIQGLVNVGIKLSSNGPVDQVVVQFSAIDP